MTEPGKQVILLVADTLVRRGLELLLSDMRFEVLAGCTEAELERQLAVSAGAPCLLILALQSWPGRSSGNDDAGRTVRRLRRRLGVDIPVIILGEESSLPVAAISEPGLIVVSDWLVADRLREEIRRCTAGEAGNS